MGSLSIWHWLIVLLIVALVCGTKKLRSLGEDLGSAVKGFKESMREGEASKKGHIQETPSGQLPDRNENKPERDSMSVS